MTADLQQIQQAAYTYARGCDRLDSELLGSCLHPDIEIIVPGLPPMGGADQAANTVAGLESMFDGTVHRVFNCLFTVTGDEAEGEVYCSASHLLKERRDGHGVIDEWAIRYQDKLVRNGKGASWSFLRRELIIDWKEERLVKLEG